jgi:predicted PurR-regulated permease PerM
MPRRRNVAAAITLLAAIITVMLPVAFIARSLIAEIIVVYQMVLSGRFAAGDWIEMMYTSIPADLRPWLYRMGLTDLEQLKTDVSRAAAQAIRIVGNQALSIGQNTFMFLLNLAVMLYLLFFFLRDGTKIAGLIDQALPLTLRQKSRFIDKFAMVVRATIKGNVIVAVIQGTLGGLIFWALDIPSATLWGVVMALLSLLPVVGASLVWGPVAIYYGLTGEYFAAIVLALFGAVVISLVDNILRPILVGKDTRMPDYLVLISTLGGLVLFGMSGFVAGPLIAVLFLVAWDLFTTRDEPTVQLPTDRSPP